MVTMANVRSDSAAGELGAGATAPGAAAPAPSSPAEVSPGEAQRLAEAFRIFNQASEELAGAYSHLQSQVAQLTAELAAANGALRQQYQEKAALTERLTILLDALPAGVVVLDGAGRIEQTNPAAEAMVPAAQVGAGWTALEGAPLCATDAPGEFLVGSEGKARRLAVVVTPLDSAGGRIVLLHDITEAQELRTQAARNQRLAAMGEMAAQLAHQLRTPLAAALLYTGNLENPDIPTATRVSIAQKAVSRLQHLERLIQDMLLFARGEVLGREEFSITELLSDLRQTFEPLAGAREVLLAVSDRSAGGLVIGNRKSLTGALTNLLENALHAAPGASERGLVPTVSLSAETIMSNDEGAATWQIRITDNGPGMDADTAARLFEPFFTTRTEGTGLGLAIARGVARAHGGAIDVVSSPGNGAEFILTLPCPLPTKP